MKYQGDHLNSSSLFVYWPLLFSSTVSRNRMENKLREFRLLNSDLKHLHILLHGPVGAEKSSFINSINNVIQGAPFLLAYIRGKIIAHSSKKKREQRVST